MDITPNLGLPYIIAAQAQKHVTHNEAIRALDAIVQLTVLDRDLSSPPASPSEGARYIVGAGATGAWAGQSGGVAAWQDGAWAHYAPVEGWTAWVADEDKLVAWDGASWVIAGGGGANPAPLVGVNTTADTTNRLAVKSDAALFSHDDVTPGSGDVRVVYNKAAPGKAASFLFQTGYSGRAEIGLTGDDKLHIKTTPDGVTWRESLVVDPATGFCGFGTAFPVGGISVERSSGLQATFIATSPSAANAGGAGMIGYIKETPTVADARLGFLLFGSRRGEANFGDHACGLQGQAEAAWTAGVSHPAYVNVVTTPPGTTTRSARWRWEGGGNYRPEADNAYTIGTATFRVASVWAANGTIQTSDARDKEVVGGLAPFAGALVDTVDPVLFRWKAGGSEVRPHPTETQLDENGQSVPRMETVTRPGNRTHAGFLAQDLKAAMDAAGADFAAWGLDDKDNPESRQWLRPDQIIPVLWAALKETRREVAALRTRVP